MQYWVAQKKSDKDNFLKLYILDKNAMQKNLFYDVIKLP